MNFLKNTAVALLGGLIFVACNNNDNKTVEQSYKLFPVKAGNNWGYIDSTCSFKLEPVFQNAGEFHNNRAFVIRAGKASYINNSAKFICDFQYLKASDFNEFKAFVLDTMNTIHCIDTSAKTLFTLKGVDEANLFYEDLAAIKKNEKYGFIDSKGKEVISCQYDAVLSFSEGLCAVAIAKIQGDSTVFDWNYIDKNGKNVFTDVYETALNFKEGFAAVCKGGQWQWINKSGKTVLPSNFEQCQSFSDGLAAFKKDGYWGVINTTGKVILEPSYAGIGSFNDGLAIASLGPNTFGFINKSGEMAIKPTFQSAAAFKEGVAYVFNDHKISLLNLKGNLFCSGQFDSAPGFLGEDLGFVEISLSGQVSVNKPEEIFE